MIIRPVGLVVAAFLTWMISIFGTTEMRWIESLIAATVMTVFCVVLFVIYSTCRSSSGRNRTRQCLVQQLAEFFRLIFGPLMKFIGVA
jgi:hypothetical protein